MLIVSDDLFDKAFKRMTRGMEDHQFRHYNRSMQCMIYSKEHYKHEMKKRGLVPYEEAERLAEEWDKKNLNKKYTGPSDKALNIIKSLRLTADKHGNIKLGGNAVRELSRLGLIRPHNPHTPVGATVGGFSD